MKKNKNLMLSLLLAFTGGVSFAQNGLESVIVEKYYVSNAADATGSIGALPAGSVTYRVYADMLPGYNFQALYGVSGHTLLINTTTSFFNNEDRGSTSPNFAAMYLNDNSVAIDSWFSVGGAANGQMGVPKSEDDGAANQITGNTMLLNTSPTAGIPLGTQDGIMAGSPVSVTFVGLSNTDLEVFNATSNAGNSFSTANGSVAALGGAVGPTVTNKVLVGQFTTDGSLHFELNIQIGTPSGGTQNYVAMNPVGAEISIPSLIYTSAPALAAATVQYCSGSTASPLSATPAAGCTLNWYTSMTGTASATAPTPSTATAGTTTYYVSQTNAMGDTSVQAPVTVIVNTTPTAAGSVVSTVGSVVTFSNTSTGASTYAWDFGDGNNSTATSPVYTYAANGNYTVTLVAINGSCTDTTTLTTDITTGINENQANQNISLYPNPATENVTLTATISKASDIIVTIYDVTGKVIATPLNEKANAGTVTYKLNVSDIPAGLYFASIKTNDATKTIRFVISK
ncbi:MAG: hypothetical protein JWP12_701 [Bacteroidetes bacterium]|nr:hypothetical protein [Bacteroidota bacterium]